MKKITAFNVLDHYRVWLRFDDGVEGEADFASHVGQGVFVPWTNYAFFHQASLGEGGRTLTWPGELDFCADALWLQVTGKRPEDLFPSLRTERSAHANP
ncbi:MAG: DUF2442 domain-containing protein [Planctomycetes bacterium]|nr:DUF2442 domain-containing protein [Verrucomicrobiota bacterium]MBM4023998.1 DUF2442 domain-containing protein [Planctomycetota bacterium]